MKRTAVILLLTVVVTSVITFLVRLRGAGPTARFDIGHKGSELAVLEDGTLVTAGPGAISAWQKESMRRVFGMRPSHPVRQVVAGQDGRFYVRDEKGNLFAFDAEGQQIAGLPTEIVNVVAMAFRNGRLAIIDSDSRLRWLDPVSLQPLPTDQRQLATSSNLLDHHDDVLCAGSFHSDQMEVFEGEKAWSIPIDRAGGIRISNDKKWIAAVTWRGELVLIDRQKRSITWEQEIGWRGQMKCVHFSPDSKRVLTCSSAAGRIWVFDCESGTIVLESAVGGDHIDARFLSDSTAVSLHVDGDLRWWSIE